MAAKKDSHISRTPLLGRLEVELSGACDHGSTRQNNVELTSFPTSNSFPTIAFIPSRTSAKDLRSFERESTENATISLHQAARDGKLELVKRRLQQFGKNCKKIDRTDADGNAALHYAVRYNHMNIVKLLLEYGADIEVQGEAGATPLHYGARFRPVSNGPHFLTPKDTPRISPGPSLKSSPKPSPRSSPKPTRKSSPQSSLHNSTEDINETEQELKKDEEQYTKKEVTKESKKKETAVGSLSKVTRGRLFNPLGKKKDSLGSRILKELQFGDRLRGVSASTSTTSLPVAVPLSPDLSIIQYLLSCNADINARDAYGSTPLHYAVAKGNPVAVSELIDHIDVYIEAKDKTRMTPLHCAASQGSLAVANCLVEAGADLRSLDEEQMTPLHFACMEGNLEVAKLLLDTAEFIGGWALVSKMVTDQDREEQTALHLAVEGGHKDLAKLCLDQGANVNATKANLSTPLHLAATGGDLEIVKMLVDHDANIEAKNILQETPLHRAALFNRVKIVQFLISKGSYVECRDKDKDTPLLTAASKNHLDTFKFLMQHGADITAKDVNDGTPLFRAASEGCIGIVEFLLKNPRSKALIEEGNKYENTPLHAAAQKGYVKIVQLLLNAGCIIDGKNDEAITPLHLATKYGKLRTVCALLNRDPSIINDEDEASNTPLHLAALYGHERLVKELLDRGAAIDARNNNLWTPLDCAAARGWVETATLLLDEDSPVDPTDKAKTTPLHLASKEGHVGMVKLLLSRKANITLRDSAGRNCLDLAIENNHKYVAMAIIDHDDWQQVMRNRIKEGNVVNTPMRKLIKKLPEVAEYVFKRCVEFSSCRADSPDYTITLNYEFLDDVNVEWTGLSSRADVTEHDNHMVDAVMYKIKAALPEKASKQLEIKSNHPLMLMVAKERVNLLSHPLVTYLLRYKWRLFGRHVYYSKLILYLTFLFFLTGYAMVTTKSLPLTKCVNDTTCVCHMNFGQPVTGSEILWRTIGRPVIIVTTCINLFIEFVQLCYVWRFYLRWHRLVEVPAYIFSLLYVADEIQTDGKLINISKGSRCYYWHNSLGATAVYLAWTGLLLFMRKFPKLGIYVVMFTEILRTFAQFFIVLGLFIIAFGLGFHVLIYDQVPFSTPGRSMLKTTMGMLGEYEYDTVYNESEVPPITWALCVLFLIINCTILMNLLVGLAVDDIKGVQEKAGLKRLAMQVDLVLDVEKALPAVLRRKFLTSHEVIHPNNARYWTIWSFWNQTVVPARAFKEAMNPEKTPLEKIQKQQEGLREELHHVKQKLKAVAQHTAQMELMMRAVIKHQGLSVEQEEDEGDDD